MSEETEVVEGEAVESEAPEESGLGATVETFGAVERKEPEPVEEPAEPVADEAVEDKRPKIEFTPEQQEFINNEIVGRKVAKLRQLEAEYERAQQRLAEYEKDKPQNQRPEVPPVPNAYDPDFEAKMKARDEAWANQIRWDEQERTRSEMALWERQQIERQQAESMNTKIQSYSQRAEGVGINAQTLQQAGAVVANFLNSPQHQPLVEYILEDEAGPSITVYLAKNPVEAQTVAQMNPARAAAYIEKTVKPKATRASKPKAPPPEVIRGKGAPAAKPGPKGATFETYN